MNSLKQSYSQPPIRSSKQNLIKTVYLLLIQFYQSFLSGYVGGSCRFQPTCSEYAKQAVHKHSVFKASRLIFTRLLKCRPFGPYGYDPIPSGDKN